MGPTQVTAMSPVVWSQGPFIFLNAPFDYFPVRDKDVAQIISLHILVKNPADFRVCQYQER